MWSIPQDFTDQSALDVTRTHLDKGPDACLVHVLDLVEVSYRLGYMAPENIELLARIVGVGRSQGIAVHGVLRLGELDIFQFRL